MANRKDRTVGRMLLYILFALFMVYLIIEMARKLLGGSLTIEELILALVVANIGFSFYLKDSVTRVESKLEGHMGGHRGKEQ